MQPGDLVRITRASIGVPKGELALIISGFTSHDEASDNPMEIWIVQFMNGRQRRYLTRDLEKISAAG